MVSTPFPRDRGPITSFFSESVMRSRWMADIVTHKSVRCRVHPMSDKHTRSLDMYTNQIYTKTSIRWLLQRCVGITHKQHTETYTDLLHTKLTSPNTYNTYAQLTYTYPYLNTHIPTHTQLHTNSSTLTQPTHRQHNTIKIMNPVTIITHPKSTHNSFIRTQSTPHTPTNINKQHSSNITPITHEKTNTRHAHTLQHNNKYNNLIIPHININGIKKLDVLIQLIQNPQADINPIQDATLAKSYKTQNVPQYTVVRTFIRNNITDLPTTLNQHNIQDAP